LRKREFGASVDKRMLGQQATASDDAAVAKQAIVRLAKAFIPLGNPYPITRTLGLNVPSSIGFLHRERQ
jgi:hypothetical protein